MKNKIFLFGMYTWVMGFRDGFLELMPPFVRTPIYKIMLRHLGKKSYIEYRTYILDIPPYTIFGGVPAEHIKNREIIE